MEKVIGFWNKPPDFLLMSLISRTIKPRVTQIRMFFFSENYAFLAGEDEIFIATLPDIVTTSTTLAFTELCSLRTDSKRTNQIKYDPVEQLVYWTEDKGYIHSCDFNGNRKELEAKGKFE